MFGELLLAMGLRKVLGLVGNLDRSIQPLGFVDRANYVATGMLTLMDWHHYLGSACGTDELCTRRSHSALDDDIGRRWAARGRRPFWPGDKDRRR